MLCVYPHGSYVATCSITHTGISSAVIKYESHVVYIAASSHCSCIRMQTCHMRVIVYNLILSQEMHIRNSILYLICVYLHAQSILLGNQST